jgi:hypothetical protein
MQAEVGETAGNLGDVLATAVGYPPDSAVRTAQGKPNLPIFNGSGSRIDPNTQVRLVGRKRSERGGTPITAWYSVAETDTGRSGVDYSTIEPLPTSRPFVREGRILAVQVKNESADITPSFANTDAAFRVPARTWEG